MAYDVNVKTETVDVETKRRVERITFYRSDDGIMSEAILTEYKIVDGNIIATDKFLIKSEKAQFDGITGFGPFFNGYISMVNDLKEEYDANGSLATGSYQKLS